MSIRSEVVRIFNELLAGSKKISELTALPSPVTTGDLLEVVRSGQNYKADGSQLPAGGGGGTWGGITGTITDQTDLVAYVTAQIGAAVAGLLDLRGTFDASGGTYPSSGGSGTAGAILKADTWIISVAGTLPTGQAVGVGDLIIAIIDTPGNTQANWGRIENNLTYVPVNKAGDTMSGNLAMGSNKVTGLAAATANGDAVRFEQIVGVEDLFMSAAGMWSKSTGGCSSLSQKEIATSLVNIRTLDFDQSSQEFCQFQMVAPRKWNNGTVTAVFYWMAQAGSGDVQWGISAGAYSNDDPLTGTLGTPVTVDDTLTAVNDIDITSATSAITIAGTPAAGDLLIFQISRNPASDTLTADACLVGVSIRFTTNAAIDA